MTDIGASAPAPGAAVPWSTGAALVTDLYELTMAAAYHEHGIGRSATFELFVRDLPPTRRFLVAAGLDDALTGLETWRFTADDVAYLAGLGTFPASFLALLADVRFTGDVWAVPEGEVVFAGEPLVRVTTPLIEAQIVETWLLNQIASHTTLASKAARVALACGKRGFVDFSARRVHGVDAGMMAARSAWMCGASGTSLVAAGRRFGIPVSGTMAHSFVMSYDDERDAFRAYARTFPDSTVVLIDTYDTVEGARRAAEVACELAGEDISIAAVRLDSGDLGALAVDVRRVLDDAGLPDVRIIASGDLDEHRIAALLDAGAPIDAFGVGTQLGTSADAPALGAVYKLVEDAVGPRMKLSARKVTLPGRKQVWRLADRDVLALHDEDVPGGRPLLRQVMAAGRRVDREPLDDIRSRAMSAIDGLPEAVRSLAPAEDPVWPVERSAGIDALVAEVESRLHAGRAPAAAGDRRG